MGLVDELEGYFARRARRRRFVMTMRDAADADTWATLSFQRSDHVEPLFGTPPHLLLSAHGMGITDAEGEMARMGWTKTVPGYSDDRGQGYVFRRDLPEVDTASSLAAMIRAAAAAILGTDRLALTIAPYRGQERLIGEAAGYRYLLWAGSFLVAAPATLLVAVITMSSPTELAVLIGALALIAVLHPFWMRHVVDAAVRLELSLEESALVELPIVGRLILPVASFLSAFVGAWLPVVLLVLIRLAF